MKKRIKKVATLCLAGVTAMSTVGASAQEVGDDIVDKMSAYE